MAEKASGGGGATTVGRPGKTSVGRGNTFTVGVKTGPRGGVKAGRVTQGWATNPTRTSTPTNAAKMGIGNKGRKK